MAMTIEYTGPSDARVIRRSEIIAAGFDDPGEDLIWNKSNVFELDVSDPIGVYLVIVDPTFRAEGDPSPGDFLNDLASMRADVDLLLFQRLFDKGTWNAATNTPALADGVGEEGDFYLVSEGGVRNLGSGAITWHVNDFVIYDEGVWSRIGGSPSEVVQGVINTAGAGSIVSGEGFSVVRTGAGLVTVTFDTPFEAAPSVVVSAVGGGGSVGPIASIRTGTTPTAASFQVEVVSIGTGYADGIFHFIATRDR